MADTAGMQDLRGIDVTKVLKGFADEENIFKSFLTVEASANRELRTYQKTAGFIVGTTTTGITGDPISNVAPGALPTVAEQSVIRNTDHVRKYMVESPWIAEEDIMDSDVMIWQVNVRDLTRAVQNQVDKRIYTVVTDNQAQGSAGVLSTAATGTGWDDTTDGNPILDILNGQQKIRAQGYNSNEAIIVMNSIEQKNLINYLITVKGSSIPSFSSAQLNKHVVMEILGNDVIVSENAVTDSVAQWIPSRSGTWKSFGSASSAVKIEEGIGRKYRVWEWGEALLTDPKSVHIITDTVTG